MELKTKGLVFIGMSSVDELDSFIVWLSPRRSASEPGGALRLFSFELIPLQEVRNSLFHRFDVFIHLFTLHFADQPFSDILGALFLQSR